MAARAVFVIGKDKRLKLSLLYPATTGRDFREILRAIDSVLLTTQNPSVATPVDWRPGDKARAAARVQVEARCLRITCNFARLAQCMVAPTLTDEQARQRFGSFQTEHMPSGEEGCPEDPNRVELRLSKSTVDLQASGISGWCRTRTAAGSGASWRVTAERSWHWGLGSHPSLGACCWGGGPPSGTIRPLCYVLVL